MAPPLLPRRNTYMRFLLRAAIAIVSAAVFVFAVATVALGLHIDTRPPQPPKNVIFMVSDGFGEAGLSLARLYKNVVLLRKAEAEAARDTAASSLTSLALAEIDAGRQRAKDNAALALSRMHRILSFICGIFEELAKAEASGEAPAGLSLGEMTLRAYGRTLERHHSRVERMLVHRTMFLLPSREELYRRLGYDEAKSGFVKRPGRELALCARAMAPGLRQLELFFTAHRIGRL